MSERRLIRCAEVALECAQLAVGGYMLVALRRAGITCRIGLHYDDVHTPGVGVPVLRCRLCGRWAVLETL